MKLDNLAGLASETLHEVESSLTLLGDLGTATYQKLLADVTTMKADMDRSAASPLTKPIVAANKACDAMLTEIKRTVKASVGSAVAAKNDASATLMALLEGFWNLEREPLMTQITMTEELLRRYVAAPDAVAAATTLNITDLFDALNTENSQLDQLYHERLEAMSQASPAASGLRNTVSDGYNSLCRIALQAVNLNPADAGLTTMFHRIDAIRKKYSALTPNKIDIKHATVVPIEPQQATGKAVTPIPTAWLDEKELTFAKDFSLTYKNNVATGEATVVLHGKGEYTGHIERVFAIV